MLLINLIEGVFEVEDDIEGCFFWFKIIDISFGSCEYGLIVGIKFFCEVVVNFYNVMYC